MTIALARYLKDFSQPAIVEPAFSSDAFDDGAFDMPFHEPEPMDPDAVRREAYAEGHEAASRDLEAQHAAEREALEEAHRAEITVLRDRYETEAATLIAARIHEMAVAIAESISDQAAQVLGPILSLDIAEKATRDLAVLLQKAILEGAAGTITLRGPAELFDILKTELGVNAALLRHVETPDLDLTAEIGGTVLVTRISAWAASLKKVLE